jgi:hypothetical protein
MATYCVVNDLTWTLNPLQMQMEDNINMDLNKVEYGSADWI